MFVRTSHIDIENHHLHFEDIFSRHSADWVKRRAQHPHRRLGPSVILGTCRVWNDSKEQAAFIEYAAELAKASYVIPYTVSKAVVLEDPVAGYLVSLLMDPFAKAKLDMLHNTFFSGAFSKHLYLEGDAFVAQASLGWFQTLEEATPIVNDLNTLPIHISGRIGSLIVSGTSITFRLSKTLQAEVFEEFKLVGID